MKQVREISSMFRPTFRIKKLNARKDEPVEAVIVRSGQEPIVVNLDIASPEDVGDTSEDVPFHPSRGER